MTARTINRLAVIVAEALVAQPGFGDSETERLEPVLAEVPEQGQVSPARIMKTAHYQIRRLQSVDVGGHDGVWCEPRA
ncbi:MAG: hypothetical protein AMXMBFR4_17020 [Candidatus Hydrogenedentota bacterium]